MFKYPTFPFHEYPAPLRFTDAEEWTEEEAKRKGCICPCCKGIAKYYQRHMNSAQALFLIRLHKRTEEGDCDDAGFVLIPWGSTGNGDYSKLRHWEFIQPKPRERQGEKNSGWWRITDAGVDFVMERSTASSCVWTYKNRLIRKATEKITIKQALAEDFDYEKLMEGGWRPEEAE